MSETARKFLAIDKSAVSSILMVRVELWHYGGITAMVKEGEYGDCEEMQRR